MLRSFFLILIFTISLFSTNLIAQEYKIKKLYENQLFDSVINHVCYDYQKNIKYVLANYTSTFTRSSIFKISNSEISKINSSTFNCPFGDTLIIQKISVDNYGNLFASSKWGIYKFDGQSWTYFVAPYLKKYDKMTYSPIYPDSLGNCYFVCTYLTKLNDVQAVVGESKLYKIDAYNQMTLLFSDTSYSQEINDLAWAINNSYVTDQLGNIWIASSQNNEQSSLFKFDPKNNEITRYKMINHETGKANSVIYVDQLMYDKRTNKLWCVYSADQQNDTRGGASALDLNTNTWEQLDQLKIENYDSLRPFNNIYNLLIDDNGEFWFGTMGWGIIKINKNKVDYNRFYITEILGLSKDNIFNMGFNKVKNSFIENNGDINLTTSKGLIVFSKNTTDISFDKANQNFKIYPNLIKESEKINFVIDESSRDNHVLIYDNLGNFVDEISCTENRTYTFDTSKLSSGKYFAKNANMIQAFIIEK